jgi:hypothetical protein
LRILPGSFRAGYVVIKAMARLLRAGLLAMTPTYPGRGLERRLPRMAPEVLVAAGLGLIGTVIRISLEAI